MAQLVALEWDSKEARVAVARSRGAEIVIEQLFTVELASAAGAESDVGGRLAAEFRARRLGRCDVLVTVGRSNIELRQLTLPPSPPEEMPDLVRFQAMRQFTTIGDDWLLDFVPLVEAGAESGSVLAAAMSPDIVGQIKAACQAAELTPKRIMLRPFAATSLLRRADGPGTQPCRLMIDLLREEADITVLDERNVLLMRTVRLPPTDDLEVISRALLGEIRRSIAAASNQLHGRRVERVVLCGEPNEELAAIQLLVRQELSLEADLFNPLESGQLAGDAATRRPSRVGRFAPLLGAIRDEAANVPPALDFLHPRKRPAPVNTRRRNGLIAGTVGSMGLAAVLLGMIQLDSLEGEADSLRVAATQLKKKLPVAEKKTKELTGIQNFLDSRVNWLEELHALSAELPPPDSIHITRLEGRNLGPGVAQITMNGSIKEADQLAELENILRKEGRKVQNKTRQEETNTDKSRFRWSFDETVTFPVGSSAVAGTAAASPVGKTAAAGKVTTERKGHAP